MSRDITFRVDPTPLGEDLTFGLPETDDDPGPIDDSNYAKLNQPNTFTRPLSVQVAVPMSGGAELLEAVVEPGPEGGRLVLPLHVAVGVVPVADDQPGVEQLRRAVAGPARGLAERLLQVPEGDRGVGLGGRADEPLELATALEDQAADLTDLLTLINTKETPAGAQAKVDVETAARASALAAHVAAADPHGDRAYADLVAAAVQAFAIQRAHHTGTLSLGDTTDSASRLAMTAAERTKLSLLTADIVIATADVSRASNATNTDDPELTVPVVAGIYLVEAMALFHGDPAGDVRTNINHPGGTVEGHAFGPQANATIANTALQTVRLSSSSNLNAGFGIIASPGHAVTWRFIYVCTTSGNLALQWAQTNSSVTATVRRQYSYLQTRKIA